MAIVVGPPLVTLDLTIGQVENLNPQGQAQSGINTGVTLNTADTGITLSSGGVIKGGQTAFNTGNGFFLGYTGAQYKVSIGDPSGDNLTWDGADLTITADAGTISGDLTVNGNFTVNGTTTTLNTATLDVEDKNITLNYGSGDTSSTANGAGITIQDAVSNTTDASILWNGATDAFDFSNSVNVTGNIVVSGTVDGRDLATDGTKLDNVEANADVTDATNVTAAGALMDSEVTNLAQVKAFDSSDYATAAQGTTADSALQNVVEDTTPQLGGDLASNGNDILFADTDKAIFGAGSDLQLYHSGSHSYIIDNGTGDLKIYGANIEIGNTSGVKNLFATSGGATTLYYNNAPKLATGNTGIDVTGTATMDGLTVDGTIASPSIIKISNSGGTWTSGDEIGRIQFYSADGSGIGAHEAASIRAVTNQGGVQTDGTLEFWRSPYNSSVVKALEIDGPTGDISFYEDTGTTAKFFWDSSAESLGIGTTPDAATVLHVQATEPQVLISDASLPLQRFMAFDVGLAADEDTHFITVDQADALAFGEKLNGDDRVIENEWMRITNAGSVGIGTDAPQALTHIYTESAINTADTLLKLTNVGNTARYVGFQAQRDNASGQGLNVLITKTDASVVNALTIDTSANVGIGTSSPTNLLDVSGAQGSGGISARVLNTNATSATTYAELKLETGLSTGAIREYSGSGSAGYMAFHNEGTEGMRIDSSGNLLVNGTNPTAKLVVDGDANAYTARFNSSTTGGQAFGTRIRAGTSSSDYALLVENTSAASMLAVRGDGNVGIGTSTPQASIHTTGDAIIGTTTSGASYEGVLQIADGAVNERTVVLIYNNHPDQFMKLGQDVNTAFIGRDQADEFAIGVFDNAADTTLSKQFVIDASGNVLIGKSSAAIAGAGTAILSSGTHNVTVDGDTTLQLNRLSSPGPIATFFADGGTVGSIGTLNSALTIGTGDTGIQFNADNNAVIPHNITTGANVDASIDIGYSSGGTNRRFKDLYLSGGVVFGATGGNVSSKTLDDYEEGTFTGAVADASSGGNESSSVLRGTYVKIGAVVYVQFNVSNISTTGMTAGNDVFITGLPFATKSVSGTAKYTGTANLSVVTFEQTPFMQVNEGETYVKILEVRSGAGNDAVVVSQLSSGASDIHGNLVYETA